MIASKPCGHKLVMSTMNWDDARQHCQTQYEVGTDLVDIKSAEEMDNLVYAMLEATPTGGNYWTGARGK